MRPAAASSRVECSLRDGNSARSEGEGVRALCIYESKGLIQPKRTALSFPCQANYAEATTSRTSTLSSVTVSGTIPRTRSAAACGLSAESKTTIDNPLVSPPSVTRVQ